MKDPGEINDLSESSSEYQTILNELLDHWAVYAAETGLIELGSDLFEKKKLKVNQMKLFIEPSLIIIESTTTTTANMY